ncbi:MAG: RNA polymerase sigma factor [Saprospiraceae bacterium]|nr:RNA polymerase sigma factor [Saprospiraceae bacterium]
MNRPPTESHRAVFDREIAPLKDKLFRYAMRILGDGPEAEDVVQDVLIKVWQKREVWQDWNNIEAMCMTITRNLAIDRSRSKHRMVKDLPDHYDEPSKDATPDQLTEAKDVMGIIKQAMSELPPKQKEVIHLREVEGHTYNEIADILDIPMSQVKINVHRARLFLRDRLNKEQLEG